MFGADAPSLNMNGKAKIKTYTGAFVTIIVGAATTLFALLKL